MLAPQRADVVALLRLPRPLKIVHFADLHLDARFAWAGAAGTASRRRREGLRDALLRIVKLAHEVGADALFSGGDLYEHDLVTPDTAEFLREAFARAAPIRVFLAPGNHDWYGPSSLYAKTRWSDNVHVFSEPRLQAVDLAEGVTLWGGAHTQPAGTGNFLAEFHAPEDGVQLALFHAAENTGFAEQGEGKERHAPFDADELTAAGVHHAFLGHYHRPKDAERHTYPGNPEPLAFGEDGVRGVVVATLGEDGRVTTERRSVATTQAHDIELDITGCASRQAVRERLAERIAGLEGVARVTLSGEQDPCVDLREEDVKDTLDGFDAALVRIGDIRPGYDIDAIRQESTVRGQFVADVLDSSLPEDEQRRVLTAGLRALDGRDDLEVL